jgi:hypothetical protein
MIAVFRLSSFLYFLPPWSAQGRIDGGILVRAIKNGELWRVSFGSAAHQRTREQIGAHGRLCW